MVDANTIKTPAIQSERRLPIGYHAGHFQQVIEGVQGRYGHFLTFDERDCLCRIDSLSQPALGLFARLANRRGPCFRVDRIRYIELADVGAAVEELTDSTDNVTDAVTDTVTDIVTVPCHHMSQ